MLGVVEERFLQAVRPDLGETGVREELSVSLLADLQHKQSEDLKSVHALMLQKVGKTLFYWMDILKR